MRQQFSKCVKGDPVFKYEEEALIFRLKGQDIKKQYITMNDVLLTAGLRVNDYNG